MIKEEYLNKFENTLIERLLDNVKMLNKNLLLSFSLLFVFLLFQLKLIDEASLGGSKLKLSESQIVLFFPLMILLPYLLINNAIANISTIVIKLKENSVKILDANKFARPFHIDDLEIHTNGIASIQLRYSKWIVKRYLSGKIYKFWIYPPDNRSTRKLIWFSIKLPLRFFYWFILLGNRINKTIFLVLTLVLIYILPLIVTLVILYQQKKALFNNIFDGIDYGGLLSYEFILFFFLILSIIYTLYSNLILYSLYFIELINLKKNVEVDGVKDIHKGILRILRYYYPKLSDQEVEK